MKKVILALFVAALAVSVNHGLMAQGATGAVILNNTTTPITMQGGTPAAGGTLFQILGGPSEDSLTPLMLASGDDIFMTGAGLPPAAADTGLFLLGTVRVPGVDPNMDAFFQARAWRDAATFDEATLRGASDVWQQATGNFPEPGSLQPPEGVALEFPGVTIVPEPTTIALGLLGAAALLFRRRK